MEIEKEIELLLEQLEKHYQAFLIKLDKLESQIGEKDDAKLLKKINDLYDHFNLHAKETETKLNQIGKDAQKEIDRQRIEKLQDEIVS